MAAVWLDFNTFNRLPRHVRAVDRIAFTADGHLQSLASVEQVMLVTKYRRGQAYAEDLLRIRDEGIIQAQDRQRCQALADYLAAIHHIDHDDPALWRRRLRDLIGHGEGIMGLTDSYPADLSYVTPAELRQIEEAANRWRWRLKGQSQRLRQVHGDFHPFNILFDEDGEVVMLDRSRGQWGEPADDLSCLSINYLFFSLQREGRLGEPFLTLHTDFWNHYFGSRVDDDLLSSIQPWFAWRALVLASPIWYPDLREETRRSRRLHDLSISNALTDEVRRKLLTFARRVLESERYDFRAVNSYLEEA